MTCCVCSIAAGIVSSVLRAKPKPKFVGVTRVGNAPFTETDYENVVIGDFFYMFDKKYHEDIMYNQTYPGYAGKFRRMKLPAGINKSSIIAVNVVSLLRFRHDLVEMPAKERVVHLSPVDFSNSVGFSGTDEQMTPDVIAGKQYVGLTDEQRSKLIYLDREKKVSSDFAIYEEEILARPIIIPVTTEEGKFESTELNAFTEYIDKVGFAGPAFDPYLTRVTARVEGDDLLVPYQGFCLLNTVPHFHQSSETMQRTNSIFKFGTGPTYELYSNTGAPMMVQLITKDNKSYTVSAVGFLPVYDPANKAGTSYTYPL